MKYIKEGDGLIIKSWCENPEQGCIDQAINLSKLPFAFRHICLMPDTHQGYGMPIGGVLATKKVVIPNAVGVDIGCGMCAVKSSIASIGRVSLKRIMAKIRQQIPVGFNHQDEIQDQKLMPNSDNMRVIISREYQSALHQIGTLGGGNHFIEIQKGSDGFVWIMVHSGSRNLGKKVADYYNKLAVQLNAKWCSSVPKEVQLAFFPIDTDGYKDYMHEMQYCVDFALANRKLMMERIKTIFHEECDCTFDNFINIAHNYANMENHFGENVFIHRKGATQAKEGQIGIIPGSQGTKSYIVKGKGNKESFESCSHGAGRRMGRKEAIKTLDLKSEIQRLDEQGIIHSIREIKDLDEAAGSYKDISVVMKEQADLVDIMVQLTPLAVIKG